MKALVVPLSDSLETQRVCFSPAETALMGSGRPTSRGYFKEEEKVD